MSKINYLEFAQNQFKLSISNLEIPDQGITAIIGPSGSGKTTFFKILIGIDQPEKLSWIFNNIEMADLDLAHRQLGVVFQNYEIFPHLTAEENITLIMKARNNYNSESLQILKEYKTKLKLEKCWLTKGLHLSGGEQQRVALLRAVLSRPRMILLDEPFSALDLELKVEAYDLVKNVLNDLKVPALMITHSLTEAQYFTNHIIEFRDGKIV